MCGIVGFTHKNGPRPDDRIHQATSSLFHRGPDQQGVHESHSVSLGAVRLKIIDLISGDQPLRSEDGGTVLVFNGEIYNFRELREELEQRGHRFRSHSDTEVVLRAFLEWDRDCLSRLRGMFALAIWTEADKRLLLARDRMGIKPLYLYRRGEDLYFGSELKAILENPGVPRQLDPTGLHFYLSLNYVPGPRTLLQGVEKLPPGHWLEWRDGRVSTGSYWRLRFEPQSRWTLDDAKEELDRLLKESIREHMVSDVPLGVWSSGGLDSSTMLHYAAEASSAQLKTFSVSFQGRRFDESRYFREVSSFYGTEHHEFDLNPEVDLASAIECLPFHADEPCADAGALPVYFLSKMSRRHVTVALSGEGADELFGGYVTYLADRWARPLRLVPPALRFLGLFAVQHWPVSDDKVSMEYKLKRFLAGSLLSPDDAHLYWNGAFSDEEKRLLCEASPGPSLQGLYDTLPPEADRAGYLNRYLWLDQLYYLPDDILNKCDRMSMAHSLEVRPAFLDHRIVEFAASLPQSLKIHGGRLKYVLRELMKDKLPPAVLNRKKEGFDIPAHDWLRGPLRSLLLDTLTGDALRHTPVFRPEAIQALIGSHLDRRANLGYHLWGLLILFLWLKTWRVETAPCEESRTMPAGIFATA